MQHECRITVLETKVFADYQEKYLADPKSGPCPCFKAGDTFTLKRTSERDDFIISWTASSAVRLGTPSAVCIYRLAGRVYHGTSGRTTSA